MTNRESMYYVDGDGDKFHISLTDNRVLSELNGAGIAPPEHYSRGRPFRDGEEHTGEGYRARVVNLMVGDRASSRSNMWSHINDWSTAFNLDKGAGYILYVFEDGTERILYCRHNGGLEFNSSDRPNPVLQNVPVQVIAHDPMFYDPATYDSYDYFSGAADVDISVNNAGDRETYPTIIIQSPVNHPLLTHVESGAQLDIDYNLDENSMVIDCDEPSIKVGGVSIIDYIGTTDEFFPLDRGGNTIRISATSGTGQCKVRRYHKYVSLRK